MPREELNYWERIRTQGYSRRRMLQGAGVAGVGLAATALVGCGDDDDDATSEPDATATSGGGSGSDPTATAVSTPTATPAADIAKRGGHVNIRTGATRSLDPHFDTWPACSATVGNVFNALLKFTPDFTEIVPDIALGMPEQADELTFIMKIRPDVTWQDIAPVSGRAFTAEDAKWSIERQMSDDPNMKHDYFFQGAVDSIDTPDNETLVFNMSKPYAPFLSYLANAWTLMLNRESVEEYGDLVENPRVGTGPFIFKGWEKDVKVEMEANPNYWKKDRFGNALPYIDSFTQHIVLDIEVASTLLIDGSLDALIAGVNQKDRISNALPDYAYKTVPTQFWNQVRMPPTTEEVPYTMLPDNAKVFADARVRQAIVQALNPQTVLDFVYAGDGLVTHGPILPMYPPWALTEDVPGAEFNLAEAKKLMDAAGNPEVKGPLMWSTGSTEADQIGEVCKQMLAEIGVDVELNPLESTSYYDLTYKYTYFMSHHTPLNNADPDENLSSYFGRNSAFFKHYNPAIWDKIDAQAAELDYEKRIELVHDVSKDIVLDFPIKFMYTTNYHEYASPKIKEWFWELDLYRNTMEGLWLDV